jgi:hypothetical protein
MTCESHCFLAHFARCACPDTHFCIGGGGWNPVVIVLEALGATVQDLCSHILFHEMCYWVVSPQYVNVTPMSVRLGPQ